MPPQRRRRKARRWLRAKIEWRYCSSRLIEGSAGHRTATRLLSFFPFPLSALACPVVTEVTALDLVFLGRSSLLFIIHHIGLSTLLDCSYISSITEIILWSGEAYLHLPRPVHQLRPPVLAGPPFIPVLVPTCPARTCLLHHRLCPPSFRWTAGRSTAAATSDS